MTAYLDGMRERECAESSIARTEHTFESMLGEVMALPIETVGRQRMKALYAKRAGGTKAGTHHVELATVRSFFAWCVKKGYTRINPAEDVEVKGRPGRGKPQPRIDDARVLLAKALELGDAGDHAAYAVALTMLTAKRASEIATRLVRDVDDGGCRLIITRAKTRASEKSIKVPEMLRERILSVAGDRAPTEPLWGYTSRGNPTDRQWLYYHVKRIVDLAGIEDTCPHGLRGAHSSVAIDEGVAIETVARALGQTNADVTRRHYVRAGAEDEAKAGAFLKVLVGGKS